MLLRSALVAFVIASVSAQNCVPGAVRNTDGNCQCEAGKSGNGDLCCYNPSATRGCYVAGDPVLTSFTNNKIGLDFPCGTRIASAQVDDINPVVDVFVAGKESSTGAILPSQIKLQIRQMVTITITFNFDLYPVIVHYKRSDAAAEDFTMSDQESRAMANDGVQGDLVIKYSKGLNLFSVHIGDIVVTIRPPKGNEAYTPGVCVLEPVGSLVPAQADSLMCNLNQDVVNSPVYLDTAIEPMKNYMFNNGILKDTTSAKYNGLCQSFQDILTSKCQASDRNNALKKCAFILFNPVSRRCFHQAGSGSARVMSSFVYCLDTYCQGTKGLCEGMQNDPKFQQCGSDKLKDCDTWPPYREANKFVAGEGDNLNFGNEGNNNQPETTGWNPLQGGILGENPDQSNGNAGGVDTGFNPDDFLF